MNDGFIKLNKKILDWEWYKDPVTRSLFIHCLLRANWKKTEWKGIQLKAGQFVASIATLSRETGYSEQQIRTALKHLLSTGELTSYQQGIFRIITINNWSRYQASNKDANNRIRIYKDYKINTYSKKRNTFCNFEQRNDDIDNNVLIKVREKLARKANEG